MPTNRSTEHGTFTVRRTYPGPARARLRCPVQRGCKSRWIDAPGSSAYELGFWVDRTEINQGGPPGGPVYVYDVTYRDIVPAERSVYSYVMTADDKVITVSVTTVEFSSAPSGTTPTFIEQCVFLDGADSSPVREKGAVELLDALGTALV